MSKQLAECEQYRFKVAFVRNDEIGSSSKWEILTAYREREDAQRYARASAERCPENTYLVLELRSATRAVGVEEFIL